MENSRIGQSETGMGGERRFGPGQASGNWDPKNGKGPSSVNYI